MKLSRKRNKEINGGARKGSKVETEEFDNKDGIGDGEDKMKTN